MAVNRLKIITHMYVHIYIYIYIYMLRDGRYAFQFQTEATNVFLLQTSRPSLGSMYLPVQWVHLPSCSVGPSTFLLNGSIYVPVQGTQGKTLRAVKHIPASSGEWRHNSTPPPCCHFVYSHRCIQTQTLLHRAHFVPVRKPNWVGRQMLLAHQM